MAGLFGVLGIAGDGLLAQVAGIDTTGQNVSNVNTPGYVRRSAILQARPLGGPSQGGVEVAGIARSFDRFAWGRVVDEQGKGGAAGARGDALAQVEGIVAPQGGPSIADKLNALFQSFNALSAFPMDIPTRTQALGAATDVAQAFSSTASQLADTRSGLLAKAQGIGAEVNERLTKIAALDARIEEATGRGEPATDLRDTRDKLAGEIGDRIGAKAIEDDKGHFTLFAAGTALVDGSSASSIDVGLDGNGALAVKAHRPGGSTIDVTSAVNEGSLGGIREARDVDVPKVQKALDQLAYDVATAVNGVHTTGVGLDAVGGRALFTPPGVVNGAAYAMSVDASVVGRPDRLAAAQNVGQLPGGNSVAVSLAALASQPLSGGAPPAQSFGAIASGVGTAKAAADSERQLRQETVAQATALRESASGVSLDEEMVNMTRFQRAFEASTKVLQTVDGLLDGLMKDLP